MKYIYDKMQDGYPKDPYRLSTTTSFDSITDSDVTFPKFVVVHSGHNEQTPLQNPDDLAGWRVKLEREFVWKPRMTNIADVTTKDQLESIMVFLKNSEYAPYLLLYQGSVSQKSIGIAKEGLKTHSIDGRCKVRISGKNLQSVYDIFTVKELENILNKLENLIQEETVETKDTPKKDAINPSHHQGTITIDGVVELQWLEHLQYHVRYKNHPERFKGAVELQIRKYMDRNGGKDSELQETLKALWYMKFLAAFIKNGEKPIFVKDIDTILGTK